MHPTLWGLGTNSNQLASDERVWGLQEAQVGRFHFSGVELDFPLVGYG